MVEAFSVKERVEAPFIGKSMFVTALAGVILSLGASYVVSEQINKIFTNVASLENGFETNFQLNSLNFNLQKDSISQLAQSKNSISNIFIDYKKIEKFSLGSKFKNNYVYLKQGTEFNQKKQRYIASSKSRSFVEKNIRLDKQLIKGEFVDNRDNSFSNAFFANIAKEIGQKQFMYFAQNNVGDDYLDDINVRSSSTDVVDTENEYSDNNKAVIAKTDSEISKFEGNVAIQQVEYSNIEGKISSPYIDKNSHYEVFLYEGMDSNGYPNGAILSHDVLKSGESSFSMKVPSNSAGYIFAKSFSKNGESKWISGKKTSKAESGIIIQRGSSALRSPDVQSIREDLVCKNNSEADVVNAAAFDIEEARSVLSFDAKIIHVNAKFSTDNGKVSIPAVDLKGELLAEIISENYYPTYAVLKKNNCDYSKIFMVNKSKMSIQEGYSVVAGVYKGKSKNVNVHVIGDREEKFVPVDDKGRFVVDGLLPGRYVLTFVDGMKEVGFDVVATFNDAVTSVYYSNDSIGIAGKVLNGDAPVSNATVEIIGSSEKTMTNSLGEFTFPEIEYSSVQDLIFDVKKCKTNSNDPGSCGYYTNHVKVDGNLKEFELKIVPKMFVEGSFLSANVDQKSDKGFIVGDSNRSHLKINLYPLSTLQNSAIVGYHNSDDVINTQRAYTSYEKGKYVIFNTPAGINLLQGIDTKTNNLVFSKIIFSDESVVDSIIH